MKKLLLAAFLTATSVEAQNNSLEPVMELSADERCELAWKKRLAAHPIGLQLTYQEKLGELNFTIVKTVVESLDERLRVESVRTPGLSLETSGYFPVTTFEGETKDYYLRLCKVISGGTPLEGFVVRIENLRTFAGTFESQYSSYTWSSPDESTGNASPTFYEFWHDSDGADILFKSSVKRLDGGVGHTIELVDIKYHLALPPILMPVDKSDSH